MEDSFVQRASDSILKHIDVVFPVFLPVLASPVGEKPSEGKDQANASKHVGIEILVPHVFGLQHREMAGKSGCDERPEVSRTLPI